MADDSLCDAGQRPKAQKTCGEEDADEGDSGEEGETTEPKVSWSSHRVLILFPFSPVSPANLSPSFSSNFMNASQMLTEAMTACKAFRAMCALKRLLSSVYPLMSFQGVLTCEQLSTVLAFKLWWLMDSCNMEFQAISAFKSFSAVLAIILLICRVFKNNMNIPFGSSFESLLASWTFVFLIFMFHLQMMLEALLCFELLTTLITVNFPAFLFTSVVIVDVMIVCSRTKRFSTSWAHSTFCL